MDNNAKRQPETLTLDLLLETGSFIGVTKGHILIERFCKAVEKGELPTDKDLKALARALDHLRYSRTDEPQSDNARRDALASFSNELGLTKKQGRQETGAGYASLMARPSITFILEEEELIRQGKTPSYARQKARQVAIEREAKLTGGAEMTTSAFEKRHKKWKPTAEMEVKLIKWTESIFGKKPGK